MGKEKQGEKSYVYNKLYYIFYYTNYTKILNFNI